MKLVVDTSIIIAVIAGEAIKPKLIDLTRDATVVVPPSVDWEIGNAFSAMLKRGRITLAQALDAIAIYQEIDLEIAEVSLVEAIRLASRFNIYAYDGYILQCAIENNLPLMSLDRDMLTIANRAGIRTIEVGF